MSSDEIPGLSEKLHSASSPRTNGWECPWHPFQVIAWLVILLFIISHYGFLVFYFPQHWRIIGYIIPGIILIIHIISTVVTTTIDPADNNVRLKLKSGMFRRGMFDRSQHEHVIENLHCHLCDSDVSKTAKHCRICDKCVNGFDHHCKWLNTCVGFRNYKCFIVTITSGLIGAVFAAIMTVIFLIIFFASRENLRYSCDVYQNISSCDDTLKILGAPVPDPLFPTVTAILFILAITATCLLGHLTFFHYYLIYNGISTFDYITSQRKTDQLTNRSNRLLCFEKRSNRISPVTMEEGKLDDVIEDIDPDNISNDSAGMMTFSRTPPPSCDIDDFENKTHNEKSHEGILRSGRSLSHHNPMSDPPDISASNELYPEINETQFSIIPDIKKMTVSAEIHDDSIASRDNSDLYHDLPVESHDISHDVTADSHGSPVLSHDLPVESHDSPLSSHDVTADSHDSSVFLHNTYVVALSNDIPLETNLDRQFISPDGHVMSCDTILQSHDNVSNSNELVTEQMKGSLPDETEEGSLISTQTPPSLQKLKKVTFSNTDYSESSKEDTYTDIKSLPSRPLPPSPLPPIGDDSNRYSPNLPEFAWHAGIGRRPLPPITFEDSIVGSHESLTSVQSSHSNTSLSSDPRYQRRTNRQTSSLTSLDSDHDRVTVRNKSKRKKPFPTNNERCSSGSQTLAPLIEY